MNITVIILTLNEEKHIIRAIESVSSFANDVYVVDSGSTDRTVSLALSVGARVLCHDFSSHARQFNWALTQLPSDTDWVFRLDADEIVTAQLSAEFSDLGSFVPIDVCGFNVGRSIVFMGREIRHGGVYPVRLVRFFRFGYGVCEDRLMDEHIVVRGKVGDLAGKIIDENLNSLSWWIQKHNVYSSREAVDILLSKYGKGSDHWGSGSLGNAGRRRWLKDNLYSRVPAQFRSFLYFFYRYIVRLGFLDGVQGLFFHVLQGFWYRFLVDVKIFEVRRHMRKSGEDVFDSIRSVFGDGFVKR